MEIRYQVIFVKRQVQIQVYSKIQTFSKKERQKHRFSTFHELETFGTRKRVLRKKIGGMLKRPVVF